MAHTIFYSWQTDTPDNCNRTFIRAALKTAIKQLKEVPEVEDSPRLDSGMEGIAGSPEVATIMFKKIESAAMFLGDVTLTGTALRSDGEKRRMPNSNVAVEMGFAAGVLGWERVICVMNEAFGKRDEQPFDVRNRRYPINYSLAADAEPEAVEQARNGLVADLKAALTAAEIAEFARVDRAIARLDVNCLHVISLYGGMDHFAEHSEFVEKHRHSIPRLLDLELIYTDVADRLYAYHWTYLGKKVIQKKFPQKLEQKAAAPVEQ